MTNTEKALESFGEGCNCAQAVFVPFAEQLGVDAETAGRISSGFGGGMHMGGACGVVTGAFMALGLKFGVDKKAAYAKTSEFIERFRKRNPAITCLDLLGADVQTAEGKEKIKSEGLRKCVCEKLVADACEILEEMGL